MNYLAIALTAFSAFTFGWFAGFNRGKKLGFFILEMVCKKLGLTDRMLHVILKSLNQDIKKEFGN